MFIPKEKPRERQKTKTLSHISKGIAGTHLHPSDTLLTTTTNNNQSLAVGGSGSLLDGLLELKAI